MIQVLNMDIENISHELGIPIKQIKPINKLDKILCLVHNSWLKSLANNELSDCKFYPGTNIWNNDELQTDCWSKIYIRVLKKQPGQVIPLPRCNLSSTSEPPLSYCQLLHYVSQSNHKNLWKSAHKKYNSPTSQSNKESSICHPAPYDIVLREVILRTYGCVIINKDDLTQFRNQDTNNQLQYAKMFETHSNIYPVLCGIETKSYIFLIHDVYIEHNLQDCVTYSPNILGLCYNKPLFIIYQLVNALKSMHDKGIVLGNITLDDVYLNEDLWIQIMPRLDCNLNEICDKADGLLEYRRSVWSPKPSCCCTDCLKTLSSRWCAGLISNFDYLMILNNLAGRKIGEPSNHHVMPWVTDFTARSGNNWRDLTKSKYRLNKGDCQLDLTYTQSTTKSEDVQQIPHHVSDVLSDITYYVYLSRRLNKSVLTKHVRPLWVPGEYPNSIQRLQQWSPEECIPEFYSDPTIFKTIHEDLPDLKFPAWASCAEDFIAKHREALESQYVSERLHHWIDLTFGYKLTGTAAVKAKNVCLTSSENNTHLCKTGIVQLFDSPHPAKYMQGPFEGKLPPRIYMNIDKRYSVSPRLTRSSEDLTAREKDEEIRNPPTNKIQGSPQSQTSQKSQNISMESERNNYHTVPKSATTTCNMIYLPKEYNPVAQLNALENLHAFSSKTFHTITEEEEKNPTKCHLEHSFDTSDDLGNSFVNRMFTESYEACLGKQNVSSESNKSIDRSSPLNFKQIMASCRLREMQILGCLVVEIFLAKKLRPLGCPNDFSARFKNCVNVLKFNMDLLPSCVKYAVCLLLQLGSSNTTDFCGKNSHFKYPMVTDKGLPPPSAHQLLQPLLSNSIFPFPNDYTKIYRLLTVLWEFENTSRFLERTCYFECDGQNCHNYENLERTKQSFVKKISECKVKTYAAQIELLLDVSTYEQFSNVEIILPFFEKLLANPDTATLAAWYLFDPIAKSLGIQNTTQKLLEPILKLYEHNDCDHATKSYSTLASIYRIKKSVKLYHHSFLLRLIVRFGLKCFLDTFSTCLIEAVGGYRDIKNIDLPLHVHRKSSGFIKSKSTKNLKYCEESINTTKEENKITSPSKKSSHTDALEPELFHFDEDNNKLQDVKLHLDFNSESDSVLDLHLNHSQAEEAIEENSFRLKDNFYNINVQKNFLDEQVLINDEYFSKDTIFDKTDPKLDVSENSTLKDEIVTVVTTQSPDIQHKSLKSKYNLENTDTTNADTSKASTAGSFVEHYECKNSRNKKSKTSYSKISDMSSDSLIWLSHRLGPVLTARYLSRNLLKMLTLCYVGDENLQYSKECEKKSSFVHNLNDLTIADSRVVGDQNASKVLECLMSIAVLYGEHFILLQYLPHMSEMISLCRRRLSPNLQGGLLSSLQLLKHLLPYLSDVVLMDQLQDVLLKSILLPCVRLLGTTKLPFPSGSQARDVLARKFVDTFYALAIRIGGEMSREHLCVPGLQRFFLTFDKAFGRNDNILDIPSRDNSTSEIVEPSPIIDDSNYLEIRSDGSTAEWKIKDSTLQLVEQDQHNSNQQEQEQQMKATTTAIMSQNNLTENYSQQTSAGLIPAQSAGANNEDPQIKAMAEIQDVFNLQLALSSYVPFLRLIGETYMEHCLLNHSLIRELCQKQYDNKPEFKIHNSDSIQDQQANNHKMADKSKTLQINIPARNNLSDNVGSSGSFGSSVAIIGNRIEVQNDGADLFRQNNTSQLGSLEMLALVSNKMDEHNSSRHLKGNWLAYWEHEIGRADKDNSFNMKQIKLQSFSGHSHAVRSIVTLDNENSFMSGSRDKTVRLWSLRSQGDGTVTSHAQYHYTGHKKSVASLTFLEAPRLVASSDPAALHVWDPFVGRTVLCESLAGVSVIRGLGGHALLAGTTEGVLKIVDVRTKSTAAQPHEWKLTTASSSGTQAVRCMCVSPTPGLWAAMGLSSGWLSLVECRTGLVRAHWKAHDAEVLQVVALGDHALVTSSLDHGVCVWSTKDGKCVAQLKGHSEPAHCLTSYHSELISGTTASRIGVHSCIETENPTFNSTKLRSETLKGLLTSMAVLPLNRMLLLGSDTGSISLLC